MLAYIGIAVSCDLVANLIFVNVVALLIFFVAHPLIYQQTIDLAHVGFKLGSIFSINLLYIYVFIAFAFVIRMYRKVESQLLEQLNLLDSFDEGLIVKTDKD